MNVEILDDLDRRRFEIYGDAELAGFVDYRLDEAVIALLHTEIDPRFQGRRLGGTLVRHVLDEARGRGLAVLPRCPYVREWITRHPDYIDLVPESRRTEFALDGNASPSDTGADGTSTES